MSHATNLSPRLEARRERLLEAAELVFAREGLRGASMERIAA
jgi:AcrR family transcriptional regulator